MKNTKILPPVMLLLLSAGTLQAQYSHLYYHRTGDTIQYDSPIYYHGWWGFEESYHSRGRTAVIMGGGPYAKELLSYHFTPAPLEVIGVATATLLRPWDQLTQSFVPPTRQEYLLIYEATPDSVFKVAEYPIDPYADTSRHIHVRGRMHRGNETSDTSRCCDGIRWDHLVPLTEYYFDSPVTVYDSFYVGYSDYSAATSPLCLSYSQWGAYTDHARKGCRWEDEEDSQSGNAICDLSWPTIRIGYSYPVASLDANDTLYANFHWIPLVFPIIRVDTTVPPAQYCPPVENLRVENLGGGTVQISWDAHPDHRYGYDVQTGSVGQPTSAWTTRYSEQNFIQIDGLQAGRGYYVRVRGFCDAEEIDISDWCQAVGFTLEDSTTAILQPSALSQHTTLHPNPATGSVAVSSDYVILSLDLYDAAGRHLWNQPVGSQHISIDLSALPAGRYLLMVSTPAGTTPKALIKQ